MIIRIAEECDIPDIERLLRQICNVHSEGRPDLFKNGGQKYNAEQIKEIINDKNRPLIVAADEGTNRVMGYAMCIIKDVPEDTALHKIKTLYLDDLCVDEELRGQGTGRKIYDYTVNFAREIGCYNLTLNVWACNEMAEKFYEKCGLKPQKTTLEKIL